MTFSPPPFKASVKSGREVRRVDFRPRSNRRKKLAGSAAFAILAVLAAMFGALGGLLLVYTVDLPQIRDLERYRPSSMTVLYDVHGNEIGSFAFERRIVVGYNDFPPVLRHAVISIEDKKFESHWGVNLFRIAGAAYHDLTEDRRSQGASTLTMQLARNLFLSPERTFHRKLQEVLLSIQIERNFTKAQIFTLYANQIYLGQGTYGFEAGSEYYFSKPARDLTLAEAALLAALPRGPSYYSPVTHPERALERRNLVLNSMLEDGVITTQQATAAKASPLGLHVKPPPNTVAPWFVETVRKELDKRFGSDMVHESGLRVYTTLDLGLQEAANSAVLNGLAAYERNQGWHGNLLNIIAAGSSIQTFHHPDWNIDPVPGAYIHGVVTEVLPYQVTVRVGGNRSVTLTPEAWAWTKNELATEFLRTGDIVYVHILPPVAAEKINSKPVQDRQAEKAQAGGNLLYASLEQDSGAQAALMAVDNTSGDILAMVGGRDFNLSQYDRATEAQRQTGSSFKAYDYTAAMEAGYKPDSMILDGPVTFRTASGNYTPHDYEHHYAGNVTLERAFADSLNIPALKLANHIGVRKIIATAHRFGITRDIPAFLPVALGAAQVSLYQQVAAYSSFPNDGIRLTPHFVHKVTTADGEVLWNDTPDVHVSTDTKTAREMMRLFQAVAHYGTAATASQLNHPVGGKTGTTNNFTDAWFLGFSPSVTCGVWVGYDNQQSLGDKQTGARVALPIWMSFMRTAIANHPNETFPGQAPQTTPTTPANLPSESGPGTVPTHP
ncbi:MAG: PBP1A family penicillin-binding protein [Acidobacteriaceae bacterium]